MFESRILHSLAMGSVVLLAACAQQPGGSTSDMSSSTHAQQMQGMNMDQMMQHCRDMQGMDRSQMSADMQRMMQQCDDMMKMHGS